MFSSVLTRYRHAPSPGLARSRLGGGRRQFCTSRGAIIDPREARASECWQ